MTSTGAAFPHPARTPTKNSYKYVRYELIFYIFVHGTNQAIQVPTKKHHKFNKKINTHSWHDSRKSSRGRPHHINPEL